MTPRTALAIKREHGRLCRQLRTARLRHTRNPWMMTEREVTRLDAAIQVLAWAIGDNAMSMSKIGRINDRDYRLRRRRAARR